MAPIGVFRSARASALAVHYLQSGDRRPSLRASTLNRVPESEDSFCRGHTVPADGRSEAPRRLELNYAVAALGYQDGVRGRDSTQHCTEYDWCTVPRTTCVPYLCTVPRTTPVPYRVPPPHYFSRSSGRKRQSEGAGGSATSLQMAPQMPSSWVKASWPAAREGLKGISQMNREDGPSREHVVLGTGLSLF